MSSKIDLGGVYFRRNFLFLIRVGLPDPSTRTGGTDELHASAIPFVGMMASLVLEPYSIVEV